MPDAGAEARRRELQRRAFAPDGGLTDAEAAELRDLSARVVAPPAPEPAPEPDRLHEEPASRRSEVASTFERAVDGAGSAADAEPLVEGSTRATSDPAPRRPGIPILVLSALVAVLLGVGVGWLAFGRGDGAHPMTDAQRKTLVALDAADEFDPGSVVLTGAKHGIEAWYATKTADDTECLVLIATAEAGDARGADDKTGVEGRQTVCQKRDEPNTFGLQANLELTVDGERAMIWAVLLEDADGERVTIIQREVLADDGTYDWRGQYSGRDLEIAEFLDSSGYDGNALQLIGRDDSIPIWMTFNGSQFCMLVAEPTALRAEGCADFDSSKGGSLELGTDRGIYQLNLTQNAEPTLTIIRTPDSIVCDVDSGYCGVDDKTGETGG